MSLEDFDVITMLQALDSTPRPKTFMRELAFAGRADTFATEEVWVDHMQGGRRMAPFVSPYVGGKLMERQGYTVQKYKPVLIQPRNILTPEQLKQREAGESIVSGRSPGDRLAGEQARILNRFDDYITRREEWMTVQLIMNGSIHFVGEGVDEEYDIGFDNVEILAGADLWSEDTADPIGDLKRWRLQCIQESGISPDVCVMASDVADAFLAHASVQSMLDLRRVDIGQINPTELPNGATYIGRISMLGLDIYAYEAEWYIDDDTGLETTMMPANQLAILPSAQRNPGARMLYGAWVEMEDGQTYEGQRIPRVWSEKGPNARIIEVVSRPLPMMPHADSWFVATVL